MTKEYRAIVGLMASFSLQVTGAQADHGPTSSGKGRLSQGKGACLI